MGALDRRGLDDYACKQRGSFHDGYVVQCIANESMVRSAKETLVVEQIQVARKANDTELGTSSLASRSDGKCRRTTTVESWDTSYSTCQPPRKISRYSSIAGFGPSAGDQHLSDKAEGGSRLRLAIRRRFTDM